MRKTLLLPAALALGLAGCGDLNPTQQRTLTGAAGGAAGGADTNGCNPGLQFQDRVPMSVRPPRRPPPPECP